METERKISVELTRQESKLISILRNIQFGEVRVIITDGRPIRIEEIKKSLKL